eukprot:g21804.t1
MYTHNYVEKFQTNAIYTFVDDTNVVGRISNNDDSEYRKKIECLVSWSNDNDLSLNVDKTKELMIDFGKKGRGHAPIYINGAEVERIDIVNFLGVHKDPYNFYRSSMRNVLSGCITAWYSNCSAQDCKKLQKVVGTAQTITEANLPSMDSIYMPQKGCQ